MTKPPKFFLIYAMPRSRTAWLSRLLTQGDSVCLHDLSLSCLSADARSADPDLMAVLMEDQVTSDIRCVGNSDSGLLLCEDRPFDDGDDVTVLKIIRPFDHVMRSLRSKMPVPGEVETLLGRHYQELIEMPTDLTVHFDEIGLLAGEIFRLCTGREPPAGYCETMESVRVDMLTSGGTRPAASPRKR